MMASNAPSSSRTTTNSSNAPETDWRAKSIKEFGLQEVPSNWSQKAHEESACKSDSQPWKEYYKSRAALEKEKRKRKAY